MTKAEFKALGDDAQIQKALEMKTFWGRTNRRLEERSRARTNGEKTAINQEISDDVDAVDLVS